MQPAIQPHRPDLHVHTCLSDGQFSPAQVMNRAAENHVDLIAVTDHDTLQGLVSAREAAMEKGIILLGGVELSAGGAWEVHILGYGIREDMGRLNALLQQMREERMARVRKMLVKLKALGMAVELEEIASPQADSLGRAHIGRALVKKGLSDSLMAAFDKYLAPGRPGYEPRPRREVGQVVRLLREEGAVPVLAHPGLIKMEREEMLPLLHEWVDQGLMGLEAYHPAHLPTAVKSWDSLAREHHLLVSGGSDFHGEDGRHMDIGQVLPYWPTAGEDAAALMKNIADAG